MPFAQAEDSLTEPLIARVALARVLIVHNRYRQPGGEDVVADAQAGLLAEKGHAVRRYERDNREINSYSLLKKAGLFFKTAHNSTTVREIKRVIAEFKPDVAHVHNTLPLISPSIYKPLNNAGVKVIQWLHNFRLVCPAGTVYRDGAPCTLCLNGDFTPALDYRCWADSKMATRALVRMLSKQRDARTWNERIDLFVALNSYQKKVLVESGGLPGHKIIVQPNFSDAWPVVQRPAANSFGEFLFAGRLAPEKGVPTLLRALEQLRDFRISIAGDGPLSDAVQRACSHPNHTWLGQLSRADLRKRMESARALLFTSEWPEGCPSIILEAMSCGLPVIASCVPGAVEILKEGQTALFYPPGNIDALAACVRQLAAPTQQGAQLETDMSQNALTQFSAAYSREAGYKNLLANYKHLKIA